MNTLNVLIIDDDPCFVPFLPKNEGVKYSFATTEHEMRVKLSEKPDVILMDGSLFGWRDNFDEGAVVVSTLRSEGLATPIIMFSSEEKKNNDGFAVGANAAYNKKLLYKERVSLLTLILQQAEVKSRIPSPETMADLAHFVEQGYLSDK